MMIESARDCEQGGWIIDDGGDCYYDPVNPDNDDPPTRWRDASELPEWWFENYEWLKERIYLQ